MIKRLLTLTLMLLTMATTAIYAQQPQEIKLNPKVRHGVLANGMNYYLMHNEEPKERANFYIAQKVGSTLETQEQLGLAHFLEHMAFNGTSHYPGKDMLNYLQSKGLRFGADINAYTSFDETVYNIDNVNTQDQALMDSVLLVLHDWSCSILLEEDEINAERGIIQEEWRMRNNAQTRMFTAMLKSIYAEPQYQQMPIGTMDVVMNFPPQAIRDYYKKWYRPDQQGIVIVGDFDVDQMEQKVKDLMGQIPMPENAAERTYPVVSDNVDPIYFSFEDPELQMPMAYIMFKYDKIPFEYRNTDIAYMLEMVRNVTAQMINNRLQEFSQKPECDYAGASVSFGDYLVASTKGALNVVVVAKNGKTQEAINDAMTIVARACKAGFTQSELERVAKENLASIEKLYNERDKTNTGTLAREIIRNFVDNEPLPGIEMEYQIAQQLYPNFPVSEVNAFAATVLTPTNEVICISQPQTDGWVLPAKDEVISLVANTLNAEYEAYEDEKITEPLIAKLPKKGKVKETRQGAFGTTELTLSNGANVIILPTDYNSDQILLTAYKKGGKQTYNTSLYADLALVDEAYEVSKIGPFEPTMLQKYLAGKKVSLGFTMGDNSTLLQGSSTIKDFPSLMEVLYASFTNVSGCPDVYNATVDSYKAILGNQEKTADYAFGKAVAETRYGGNPMKAMFSTETIDAANYNQMLDILKKATANAADYTFLLVGNIDKVDYLPLIEQYIASLPSTKKATAAPVVTPINTVDGRVINEFTFPMDTPSTMILQDYNGTITPSIENVVKIDLAGQILSNIFTATLREEEGGAYSPYAYGYVDYPNGKWHIMASIQTNSEQQQKMIDRAKEELMKMLRNGVSADDFNKVKGAAVNQYQQKIRTNDYWLNGLRMRLMGFDTVTNHQAAIENLTLEQFNAFLKGLYDDKNFIEVVMTGVAK